MTRSIGWTRALFWFAAAYDGVLGAAFLLAGPAIYDALGIVPPNHWGYIHFAAAMLVIFACMFVRIALDPLRWRSLIFYGLLLKVAYVSVVIGHAIGGGVPGVFVLFAWIDAAMAAAFACAWRQLTNASRSADPDTP